MRRLSWQNVGPPNTPEDIQRLRYENMDYCRLMGEPVVHKHMWNNDDLDAGKVKRCPACWDSAYGQVRNDCPVCFGVGLVSVEDDATHYIDANGRITTTVTATHAPQWGGFGESTLTWIVEPDAAEDVFKINPQGVLQRIQQAQAITPWYPDINDNDLIINVDLDLDTYNVTQSQDRYQAKMTNPMTIRGFGRRSQNKGFLVAQQFEMSRIPNTGSKISILYSVPIDN